MGAQNSVLSLALFPSLTNMIAITLIVLNLILMYRVVVSGWGGGGGGGKVDAQNPLFSLLYF